MLVPVISFHYLSPMHPDVVTILDAVPEYAERYLDLVEVVDGDPGPAAAFAELAEWAAELVLGLERYRPTLVQVLACVEDLARHSEDAEELVGWAFLDGLSPDDLRRLEPWFGTATRAILDGLDIEADEPRRRPSVPEESESGPGSGRAEGRP